MWCKIAFLFLLHLTKAIQNGSSIRLYKMNCKLSFENLWLRHSGFFFKPKKYPKIPVPSVKLFSLVSSGPFILEVFENEFLKKNWHEVFRIMFSLCKLTSLFCPFSPAACFHFIRSLCFALLPCPKHWTPIAWYVVTRSQVSICKKIQIIIISYI